MKMRGDFGSFYNLMTSPASKLLDQFFESEPLKVTTHYSHHQNYQFKLYNVEQTKIDIHKRPRWPPMRWLEPWWVLETQLEAATSYCIMWWVPSKVTRVRGLTQKGEWVECRTQWPNLLSPTGLPFSQTRLHRISQQLKRIFSETCRYPGRGTDAAGRLGSSARGPIEEWSWNSFENRLVQRHTESNLQRPTAERRVTTTLHGQSQFHWLHITRRQNQRYPSHINHSISSIARSQSNTEKIRIISLQVNLGWVSGLSPNGECFDYAASRCVWPGVLDLHHCQVV